MKPPDLTEPGSILVLCDGRFLPADEFSLSWEKQTEPVHTVSGNRAGVSVKTSQYIVEFETRRAPMLRPASIQDVLVYTRGTEIILEDAVFDGMDVSGGQGDDVWKVRMIGSGAMVNERKT